MIDKSHIVPVALTDKEFKALEEMSQNQGIRQEQVMVQGLRLVQLYYYGRVTVNDDGPSKTLGEHDAGCQMRFPPFNHCTCAKSVAELTADVPFKNMPPAERAKLRPANYAMLPQQEQWEIDRRLGLLDWEGPRMLP